MTKQEQIEKLAKLIVDIQLDSLRQTCRTPSSTDYAKALYDAGYRKIDVVNDVLNDAIDATFRGAVLRLAEKLKQRSYCDNCFKDGKWHRYVFIEDIDETAQKFLESET